MTVTYSMEFEQERARLDAGIGKDEYLALPGSPRWVTDESAGLSKSDVVIAYRMNNLIKAVAEDAIARKSRKR